MIVSEKGNESRLLFIQIINDSFVWNLCFNSADNQQILATFAQENSF